MCLFTLFGYLLLDATDWRAFIAGQDESGRSRIRLCGVQSGRRFCVNDLLVQNKYAAVVGSSQPGTFLADLEMKQKFLLRQE